MKRATRRATPASHASLTAPSTMSKAKSDAHTLPLDATLRDLALLRACDVNLSSLLPPEAPSEGAVDKSVARSHEFANEARAAIRMLNRGSVEDQGERLEGVRAVLEDAAGALET